ncbi:MAG: sensor histidine kinase [Solirubrobacteraceae bacterium]
MPRRADLLWTALVTALSLAVLQVDGSTATRGDRAPDLLAAALAIAACVPVAVRRTHPLAAAVVGLPFASAALALGYTVIVPVLVGLTLCGWAAIHSTRPVTVPLAAYAGTVMAAAVAITGDDSPLLVRLLGGAAIGVTAVLIGHAVRSERERTREAQEFARRIAELRDRDVERAVVEERLRIARDLHDITGHHLSAISLQAAGAGRTSADPVARATFERIHRLTSEALGQTQRALGALRDVASGRAAALAPTPRLEHVEALLEPARDAGIAVDLRLDGPDRPLSDELEVCAYRVVQESLTNVVRHAGASAVRVEVTFGEREMRIVVDDDGVGGPARPGGGIEGMRERVAIVGGRFSAGPIGDGRRAGPAGGGGVDGSVRSGWSVRAILPLDASMNADADADADLNPGPGPALGPTPHPPRDRRWPVPNSTEVTP